MFEVYAADVQFHTESRLRERRLAWRAQRAERASGMSPAALASTAPHRRSVIDATRLRQPATPRAAGAWPRPIALHA
jgi:hypothetical protein